MLLIASMFYFGLLGVAAMAQTRLDSSQVKPLSGAVQGSFNGTILRDVNSAADHGNGSTNGIASAISACGTTLSCSILAPPAYGTTEKVPGYGLNFNGAQPAATTPGNISIFDRRYSDARMFVNNPGFTVSFINSPIGWLYDYYKPAARNANYSAFYLRQWSIDGGNNQSATALNYVDKTNWTNAQIDSISHTPGQHVTLGLLGQNMSLGSHVAIQTSVTCYGGLNAQGDTGCRTEDNGIIMGNVEYSGTLSGTPATGAASLTVSPTQGQYTQGSGRFLARMSAGAISAGSISQITSGFAPAQITGSGTAWPVSTVIAQLGTNVSSPGPLTVTPASFTTGSIAGIKTSSLVCVSDGNSFEMVYPASVAGAGFTANFAKIHPSDAIISVGGLCGYLLDLTADDATNSTFPTRTQTITGKLHFAWPVISSTSPTALSLWVTGDGYWLQLSSEWNASSANGYVLYPFAEVISAQAGGAVSDTLSLAPNNVAWAAGDTVSEFIYPSMHFTWGNTLVESYYPNSAPTDGFALHYNMPLQGADSMISLLNNTPASFYLANGGTAFGPFGVRLLGQIAQGVTFDRPSDTAAISVACPSPCSSLSTVLAAKNTTYYDFAFYDPSQKGWSLSATSNATRYYFGPSQFNSPFWNVVLANDGAGKGYVGTPELRSGTSANSDNSGELVLSNTSTVTQTLKGSYASHPECSARPQFNIGSTNRHWITYTAATAFTINFATPVTGTVSYSCAARN